MDLAGSPLLVNEIAPRVHNSGHWTLDGSVTSQFEQHIRAVCGFPLGVSARPRSGRDAQSHRRRYLALARISRMPGACLHLYGKSEARPGRKMGHVTILKGAK